jgi:hypothetical protein
MDRDEIENLHQNLAELKQAVSRNNPLLREILSPRPWVVFTLVFGVFVFAFCLGWRAIIQIHGTFAALPSDLKLAFWVSLAVPLVAGSVGKLIFMAQRIAVLINDASLRTVIRTVYGGKGFHLFVPVPVCTLAVSFFSVAIGHPWYIVPAIAVFSGFTFNGAGVLLDKVEYFVSGWFLVASGLVSLFFLERDPFLWMAASLGGMCFVFGLVALAAEWGKKRRSPSPSRLHLVS